MDDWLDMPAAVPRADVAVPPARYAVPVSTMPPLEAGELVTHGRPGQWWILDQAQVVDGPHRIDGQEFYDVCALAEFGAARVRPKVHATPGALSVVMNRVPVERLWYYRDLDAPSGEPTGERQESLLAWFDRMVQNLDTPPPLRRPTRLRGVSGGTTGRLVRALTTDDVTWAWAMTVSEPLDTPDGIVVKLVDVREYHALIYQQDMDTVRARNVLLHRLWTY